MILMEKMILEAKLKPRYLMHDPLAAKIFEHVQGCDCRKIKELERLVAEAISTGRLDIFKMADEDGLTFLMTASLLSKPAFASMLAPLSNPNAECSMGMTALRLAIDAGCVDCSTLLLPLTDVRIFDHQDVSPRTAIQYNQRFSHAEVDALLIMHDQRLAALKAFDEMLSIAESTPASSSSSRRMARI